MLQAQLGRLFSRRDEDSRRRTYPHRLSSSHRGGMGIRMPGGSGNSAYYGNSTELLPKYAWYQSNSDDRSWPTGRLLPNDLGLFDMLGNVYEWCQDRDGAYRCTEKGVFKDLVIDEVVSKQQVRMFRGGGFTASATEARSASGALNFRRMMATSWVSASQGRYGGLREPVAPQRSDSFLPAHSDWHDVLRVVRDREGHGTGARKIPAWLRTPFGDDTIVSRPPSGTHSSCL